MSIREIPPTDLAKTDFYLDAPFDTWREMLENIKAHGMRTASTRSTASTSWIRLVSPNRTIRAKGTDSTATGSRSSSSYLANVDNSFCAIAGECTHMGGPLAEGAMGHSIVTCSWHGSMFDVTSGEVQVAVG